MSAVLLYYSPFQDNITARLKMVFLFLYLIFMHYLCEKYGKSITVQYYTANRVSWISRLTLFDLRTNRTPWMHSWNGICSYVGDLLYRWCWGLVSCCNNKASNCKDQSGTGQLGAGTETDCDLRSCTVSIWVSQVALVVKTPPAVQELQEKRVQFLGLEDPLGEGMATRSSILAWRIPRTQEHGGLQSIRSQRGGHDWSNSECTHAHSVHSATHPMNNSVIVLRLKQ